MRVRASGRRRFSGFHTLAQSDLTRARNSETYPGPTSGSNIALDRNGNIIVKFSKDSVTLSGSYDFDIEIEPAEVIRMVRLLGSNIQFSAEHVADFLSAALTSKKAL